MPGPLILRADGSSRIGTGHVMRCLALAQAWQDQGGHAVFAAAELSPALTTRLQAEGFEVRLVQNGEAPPPGWSGADSWAVLDGYHFSSATQQLWKNAGFRVLAIDDNGHSTPACADLLLNPNLHAAPELHAGHAPHTKLLLGPHYAPLRREFTALHPKSPDAAAQPVRRILISLGGADPLNRTLDVLRLASTAAPEGTQWRVIAGGSNPHLPLLREWMGSRPGFELIVDAPRMDTHYLWADAAVLPASTTCLEAFRCGLPCLLIASVDNQREIAARARAEDLAGVVEAFDSLDSGPFFSSWKHLIHNPAERSSRAARTAALVDGLGARRTIAFMHAFPDRP